MDQNGFSFNIQPYTDMDKANEMGIPGRSPEEAEQMISDELHRIEQEKHKVRSYEVLGKYFMMENGLAEGTLSLRNTNSKYKRFDRKDVPEMYIAGVEWCFEKELNGRPFTADKWPEILKLMDNRLFTYPGVNVDRSLYRKADGTYNEDILLTIFGIYIFGQIQELILYC